MKGFFIGATSLVVGSLTLISGCEVTTNNNEEVAPAPTETPLELMVSIPPQEYFVTKIGGDRITVDVMVPQNSEPETYEPKPQQISRLTEMDAYISIGFPFETKWLPQFQEVNPEMIIIDSGAGIQRLEMAHEHHHHEEHEDHDSSLEAEVQENFDPHIWLSPTLVKIQAQNIYQRLIELDPDHQSEYEENLNQFLTEIDQLDQQIRDNLNNIANRKFIVFHPAWTYFAQDYNLEQIPIEVGGQEPSASELAEVIKIAKEEGIKVVFAQPQFNLKDPTTIAQEIEGEVVTIDVLDPNWSDNLLNVSETFQTYLN